MFDNVYPHSVDRNNEEEIKKLRAFLKSVGLRYEETAEYTCVFLDSNEEIVGTGSCEGNILKCIGVHPQWRDQGLLGKIVTHLVEKEAERGIYTVFVFTRLDNVELFRGLAMRELARCDRFALFETGFGGILNYQQYLRTRLKFAEEKKREKGDAIQSAGASGCVIVNCNPFTKGHRYLIETAAARCNHLFVIVVETDLSLFPFNVRYELIEKGTADLENVTVVKGGDYVISRYTFPTYFLRDETQLQIAASQSELDVRLFAKWIAPVLGVKYRFVGTEDYCPTTHSYNNAMKAILPLYGIELVEIERKVLKDDDRPVSASRVRAAIRNDDWQLVRELVPDTTYEFLRSERAKPVIEKIKTSNARH